MKKDQQGGRDLEAAHQELPKSWYRTIHQKTLFGKQHSSPETSQSWSATTFCTLDDTFPLFSQQHPPPAQATANNLELSNKDPPSSASTLASLLATQPPIAPQALPSRLPSKVRKRHKKKRPWGGKTRKQANQRGISAPDNVTRSF